MAEFPKRPADVVRAGASRITKPGALTGETARAADSVPVAIGPFAKLPTQFGRYRIDKLLGKGMMGAVYLAHDTELDRQIALKVARVSSAGSAKLIKRMETEAKAAAKIDHPLICRVYDFGEIDNVRFIALQYIEGEDLKSYLKRVGRRREPAEAIKLVLQLAGALEAAHAKGVIHRDLKPENVMLNRKGEPVIMDFGLARLATGNVNAGLTQGMILGTAAYMSPEQAVGKAEGIDHRSDQYALGVMLFEMLTGEWPFTGSAIEIMGRKCVQEAQSPLTVHPDLPPQLATICHKMIAQKKEDRYSSCADVISALESVDLNSAGISAGAAEITAAVSTIDVLDQSLFHFVDSSSAAAPTPIAAPLRKRNAARKIAIPNVAVAVTNWWHGQSPSRRWSILGSAGICMTVLAAVMFFRSGEALVKVEIHSDDVEVTFQKETLTLADGAKKYKVTPGGQTLHIKAGDLEFDTNKFTLKRGENPAVTVEIVSEEIVTKFGDQEIGRRPLSVSSTNQADGNRKSIDTAKVGWRGWPIDAPPPAIAPFDAAQAKKHQEAWAAYLKLPVEYTNSIGMKFRLIPPGEFMMGSTPEEIEVGVKLDPGFPFWQECLKCEVPKHKVILTRPYYMSIGEVQQQHYKIIMKTNPAEFSNTGSRKHNVADSDTSMFPVEMVNWNDAAEFCSKLSKHDRFQPFYIREGETVTSLEGTGYRLPTEAEWEFACRAGTLTQYWIGRSDEDLVRAGWFVGNSGGRPHSQGELLGNPFGLFDTHGNVREWVADCWGQSYYQQSGMTPAINPTGPTTGSSRRVVRGGGYGAVGSCSRASCRHGDEPTYRDNVIGIRVALNVEAVKTAIDAAGWQGWSIGAPLPAIAPFDAAQAKKHQEAWATYLKVPVEYTNSIGMKFRLIPPGEFVMGSTQEEIGEALKVAGSDKHWQDRLQSEAPQHRTILTNPIYLGTHEVTQDEYEKVMQTNPSHFAPTGKGNAAIASLDFANHPVETVSWNDAAEFCAKLSLREKLKPSYVRIGDTSTPINGTGYRLPTEAEWEFASHGGTTTKYWIGDTDEELARAGWFRINSGWRTHAVAELNVNPFGLYDICGNVWEWVQDRWEPTYYGQFKETAAINPNGPSSGSPQFVLRGGGWDNAASNCRASNRTARAAWDRGSPYGFRVSLPVGAVRDLNIP